MFVEDLMACTKHDATLTLRKTETSEIFLLNNQNGYCEVLPYQKDTYVFLRKDIVRLYHLHILSLKMPYMDDICNLYGRNSIYLLFHM